MQQNTSDIKIARVIAQHRGKYRVLLNNKEFWAEVTGKLIYAALSQLDYPGCKTTAGNLAMLYSQGNIDA